MTTAVHVHTLNILSDIGDQTLQTRLLSFTQSPHRYVIVWYKSVHLLIQKPYFMQCMFC